MNKIEQIRARTKEYLDLAHDDATPLSAQILLFAAVGYFIWPFDLIPDFIPIIGYLDDLIIVPSLIWLAFRQIEAARIERKARQLQLGSAGIVEADHCAEEK